jgi:RimJ/RimL family protein N-acetyltransferase
MIDQPALETLRLRLRALQTPDAANIQQAASVRAVADTMISLPHPYPAGEAARYLARQQAERERGLSVTYALERKADAGFTGLIELRAIEREHSQAELSFWLAVEAWGRGYMTEAVAAVVAYAFEGLGLNRLYAFHMVRNPGSGRVLEKNGFQREGLLRQRVRKWGRFEDVALWAILREDWQR